MLFVLTLLFGLPSERIRRLTADQLTQDDQNQHTYLAAGRHPILLLPPRLAGCCAAWPVGAENSSTSCDLGVFVDQPAYSIDPHDGHIGCRGGWRDGPER